ncbi:MAG: SoxR reducing system RseC family protein, partial [Clostridium sp.]|nr:SoxR reducing system RseC family protein [Clostridium sp.]
MNIKSSNKRWFEKNRYLIILVTFFLGVAGASFLNYIFKGELYLDGVIIVGTYVAIAFLIIFIRRKLKKKTLPDADERVKSNIFNFYFFMAHIFLSLLFLT